MLVLVPHVEDTPELPAYYPLFLTIFGISCSASARLSRMGDAPEVAMGLLLRGDLDLVGAYYCRTLKPKLNIWRYFGVKLKSTGYNQMVL